MGALVIVSTGYFFDHLAQDREQRADKMALEGLSDGDGMYLYRDSEEFRCYPIPWEKPGSHKKRNSAIYKTMNSHPSLLRILLPLIIWGVYEILWGEGRWLVLVWGMTGVLESHVLSTEICILQNNELPPLSPSYPLSSPKGANTKSHLPIKRLRWLWAFHQCFRQS